MQMWMLPVDMKGSDVVECAALVPRTEYFFHPRSAGSVCVIGIGAMRKADDDVRGEVHVAFCLCLASLIVAGLLGPTACHLVKAIVWDRNTLMTRGSQEVNGALARQVIQLIPDLACGTSAALRHNSYDGLRGHLGHLTATFPENPLTVRSPAIIFDRLAAVGKCSILCEARHRGQQILGQTAAYGSQTVRYSLCHRGLQSGSYR
ncbi:hypothetical protein MPL3356_340090 [Mesorhizobium plurifarium]|uniref:Uncharacterized protein n=1 Tax=Mesorhizobium plurifarium TaxID=69974 RepID=A0A090DV68_MESPL|nr:hypothetical protein MPL3356_340090 [Mesorhizobium plurifarium]